MKLTITLVLSLVVLCGYAQEPVRVIDLDQIQGDVFGLKNAVGESDPYTGVVLSHYPGGEKRSEGNFINGRPEGVWTEWYESGQKKVESNLVNGQLESVVTEWDENGDVR